MSLPSLRKLDRYIKVNRRDIQRLQEGLFGNIASENVFFTSNTNISSTNVQDALVEVSNETISSLALKADLVLGKVPASQLPTLEYPLINTLPLLP